MGMATPMVALPPQLVLGRARSTSLLPQGHGTKSVRAKDKATLLLPRALVWDTAGS